METSRDGDAWDLALSADRLLTGGHWWRGHPRLEESGRLVLRMVPRPARYVRLRAAPGETLSISEVFAYEDDAGSWMPPAEAREAYRSAQRALAHWMDDPGGPHPKRAPVTAEYRRRQVPWAEVFGGLERALALTPHWEEPHHLYGRALTLWGSPQRAPDVAVERARTDGAWGQVLQWVAVAEAERPGLWRSGRNAAQIEALERLGRGAEAAAVRAERARTPAGRLPATRVGALFGGTVELVGVDLPAEARPGERLSVRYAWRLARPVSRDYDAFVHLRGPGRMLLHDHRLGEDFGTSRWGPEEHVAETLVLEVPADAPPGRYEVTAGVWWPSTGRRLAVTGTTLPVRRDAVAVGTLTIAP